MLNHATTPLQVTVLLGRCLVRIPARAPAILVPPVKLLDSPSIRTLPHPSKSFSINHSTVILPFGTTQSPYWQQSKMDYDQTIQLITRLHSNNEPGQLSRYSDWLQAGRQMYQSSNPGGIKNFLLIFSPDRLWGSPSLLSKGYRRPFLRG
jgi:hypothetical protein